MSHPITKEIKMAVIEAGQEAPDFTLRDQTRTEQTLSDYRGKPVLLLFYPLDFSGVCTEEMGCVMDILPRLNALDAQVFGISVDSHHSHRVFAEQRGIEYPLLADFHPKGKVAQAYGVYLDDYGISSRAWVVIDGEGRVVAAEDVGPPNMPDFDTIVAAVERAGVEQGLQKRRMTAGAHRHAVRPCLCRAARASAARRW